MFRASCLLNRMIVILPIHQGQVPSFKTPKTTITHFLWHKTRQCLCLQCVPARTVKVQRHLQICLKSWISHSLSFNMEGIIWCLSCNSRLIDHQLKVRLSHHSRITWIDQKQNHLTRNFGQRTNPIMIITSKWIHLSTGFKRIVPPLPSQVKKMKMTPT